MCRWGDMFHRLAFSFFAVTIVTLAHAHAWAEQPATPSLPVRVHTDDPDVELQQQLMPGEAWQALCTSPCDRDVALAPSTRYRFSGSGVASSKPFHLAPGAQTADFTVDPGYTWMKVTGWVAVGVGSAMVPIGLSVSFLEYAESVGCNFRCDKTELYGGLGAAAGGVVLALGVGLPLLLVGRTTFEAQYDRGQVALTADGVKVRF